MPSATAQSRPRVELATRAQGLWLVQGSGFRVQGSGFRVQGSGLRAQGSGFRAQGRGTGSGLGKLALGRGRPMLFGCDMP